MAAIKFCTDLKQSNILKGILPIESADNYYSWHDERYYIVSKDCPYPYSLKEKTPCWSLAALLSVLPSSTLDSSDDHHYRLRCKERFTEWHSNQIDACYEMILKLNEQKLLEKGLAISTEEYNPYDL